MFTKHPIPGKYYCWHCELPMDEGHVSKTIYYPNGTTGMNWNSNDSISTCVTYSTESREIVRCTKCGKVLDKAV
jgi:hypothetical protein